MRSRLIAGIYVDAAAGNPLGGVNETFQLAVTVAPLERKIHAAVKAGKVADLTGIELTQAALQAGVVKREEADLLQQYHEKMLAVIGVDEFPYDAFSRAPKPARRTTKKRVARKKKTVRKRKATTPDRSPDAGGK